MEIGDILTKRNDEDGWHYTHNEIIERISELYINCPECESIIHSDSQYQCGTCGGGAKINVLRYITEDAK